MGSCCKPKFCRLSRFAVYALSQASSVYFRYPTGEAFCHKESCSSRLPDSWYVLNFFFPRPYGGHGQWSTVTDDVETCQAFMPFVASSKAPIPSMSYWSSCCSRLRSSRQEIGKDVNVQEDEERQRRWRKYSSLLYYCLFQYMYGWILLLLLM